MANPKLGAKGVPGVACYPLVTHKKISIKFWGSHNWCPWTCILDSHIGQSYWTVIMTVLFFIVPVQYDCPVCEMCLNKPSSSHKNVRPLFIVKIWILGYNEEGSTLFEVRSRSYPIMRVAAIKSLDTRRQVRSPFVVRCRRRREAICCAERERERESPRQTSEVR